MDLIRVTAMNRVFDVTMATIQPSEELVRPVRRTDHTDSARIQLGAASRPGIGNSRLMVGEHHPGMGIVPWPS